MDAPTFERWVNDLALEYRDANNLWEQPVAMSVLNGFVGWLTTKYHMEMEDLARDKFADPCCGGTCKEET